MMRAYFRAGRRFHRFTLIKSAFKFLYVYVGDG